VTAPPGRWQGWWGIAFVALLLPSEAAVALPRTSHTTVFIGEYYARHRVAITLAQVGQLVATALLLMFVLALARRTGGAMRRRVAAAGAVVVIVSVLTNLPVLALALLPGLSAGATRTLATWTDLTDVVEFAAIAGFAVVCLLAFTARWLRFGAAAVTVVSLVHAALSLGRLGTLEALAPLAFLAFVLALAVGMLREPRPTEGTPRSLSPSVAAAPGR
jgi:hypothetical protein